MIEPGSKFSKKNFESQQSSTQSQQKVTVELNDLDWADRETVLRLLFSKMNTGDTAGSWREAVNASQPSRSRGSKQTGDVNGPNQDLNRGFRYDEYGEQLPEDQQQYDDQEYYDE